MEDTPENGSEHRLCRGRRGGRWEITSDGTLGSLVLRDVAQVVEV